MTVISDALAGHYAAHGLPADGGESATTFRVHIGPLTIPLPNPPARRRAVFFHDVNHVLTGYNTVFSDGEMAIAGFEIGAGCGPFWIAWYINLSMMAIGLVVNPRETFRAFVRGRHTSSLYRRWESRETLAAMPVAELRESLGIDRPTPATSVGDIASFAAWTVVGVFVLLAPLALAVVVLKAVF